MKLRQEPRYCVMLSDDFPKRSSLLQEALEDLLLDLTRIIIMSKLYIALVHSVIICFALLRLTKKKFNCLPASEKKKGEGGGGGHPTPSPMEIS